LKREAAFLLPGPALTDKACCGSGASPTDKQTGRQARAGQGKTGRQGDERGRGPQGAS
jgi:hypothetical protein